MANVIAFFEKEYSMSRYYLLTYEELLYAYIYGLDGTEKTFSTIQKAIDSFSNQISDSYIVDDKLNKIYGFRHITKEIIKYE